MITLHMKILILDCALALLKLLNYYKEKKVYYSKNLIDI